MPILPPIPGPGAGAPQLGKNYTPQDALTLVKHFAHGIPVADVAANVCDIVNSMFWVFYPWCWSLNTLTPIPLVNGVQDYQALDNNILRPIRVQLARTDITPNENRDLSLLANLGVELTRTGGIDTITSVGWYPSDPFFRLNYAASVSGTQTLQIQGVYQMLPTRIDESNLMVPFEFPDRYYNVFIEGLKWKLYQLADDQRAGTIQYVKNGSMQRVYTGQLGLFMDALLTAARTEDLSSGDEFSFPEQPLGVGRSYWPGMYGI